MFRNCILALFLALPTIVLADNEQLYEELDAALEHRAQYIQEKEAKITALKQEISAETDSMAILKNLDELYNEYHVFKFDSAKAYADRGLALAIRQKDDYYSDLFTINYVEILATGGLYSQALEFYEAMDPAKLDNKLRSKYYLRGFSLFTYWADYCNDQHYSPKYRAKANNYLELAIQNMDENDQFYEYYLGEQCVYVYYDNQKSISHYLKAIRQLKEDSRVHAMACFSLAYRYQVENDMERYEEYMIRSALGDLRSCTMENLSLQTLAMHLFQKGEKHIERSERYIKTSMEDAMFYNNRLRILEISHILPQIMTSYQQVTESQNQRLRYSVIFISLLVVALLFTAYFIHRQNKKLASRRKKLAENYRQLTSLNQQLHESNQHQTDLNSQLNELNQRLIDTNKRRESLASIYIDLCAKYIDKLGKYQTFVKRKIKANQAQELLQTISSTRISEEDAATFLTRFDKAFLELYPSFVDEFNALLTEEGRIVQKFPHTLTTELRTFALIRLGVKNTPDIAGLLFLSNQTIYNCRSLTKNKAINKETFDDDVQKLCTVV